MDQRASTKGKKLKFKLLQAKLFSPYFSGQHGLIGDMIRGINSSNRCLNGSEARTRWRTLLGLIRNDEPRVYHDLKFEKWSCKAFILHFLFCNFLDILSCFRFALDHYDSIITSKKDVDADKVCAKLADEFNAFGILTQDTDFLIFQYSPDVHLFWSKDL